MPAIPNAQVRSSARRTLAVAFALAALAQPARSEAFVAFEPAAGRAPAALGARDLDGGPLPVAPDAGRVTLVHFFASWCAPCEAELPALLRFVDERKDRVRLVAVDVGEPASRARKFVARFAFPGPVAHDEDQSITRAYGMRGLPATVALAPGGSRMLAARGPVDWRAPEIAEALDRLSAD